MDGRPLHVAATGGPVLAAVALLALGVAQLFAAGFVFCYARGTFRTGFVYAAFLTLLIYATWDAVPTWLAFEYYSNKEAGATVLKPLAQWKLEHPEVATPLQTHQEIDGVAKPFEDINFTSTNGYRHPLNGRFAVDAQLFDKLFLTVYAHRYSIVDVSSGEVLARYVDIRSGNSGGIATGGPGWWALWLIHRSAESSKPYDDYEQAVKLMGAMTGAVRGD